MDTTVVLVILGVVAALAVGVFVYLRGRPKMEEVYSHFRCPKCRRRLRYHSRQVGRKAKCSNCGNDVIFPPLAESID
jgi:DNA-directed RNA polymerase subunit RPC12/RpoP